VKIDNPSHDPRPLTTPPEVIDLSIDFDGNIAVEQENGGSHHDAELYQPRGAKNPQPEVHIAVDKFSKYENRGANVADLQHRGLKTIGFVNNDFF